MGLRTRRRGPGNWAAGAALFFALHSVGAVASVLVPPEAWPTPPTAARLWRLSAGVHYRLLVLPGSGCPSLPLRQAGAWAAAFPGAEIVLVQKPWLGEAGDCTPDFARHDRLSSWQQAALRALEGLPSSRLPLLVLALSEGAEIAPTLFQALPEARALVTVGASGLDPRQLAEHLHGQEGSWQRLLRRTEGTEADATLVDGRSLGYWRDLLGWPVGARLRALQRPWLRVWGRADALVPVPLYAQYERLYAPLQDPSPEPSRQRAVRTGQAGLCDWPMPGADHALQGPGGDGLQQLGAALLRWVRDQEPWPCRPINPW